MMEKELLTTREYAIRTMAHCLGQPEKKLTDEAHFLEDLGADSLDLAELIMQLEDLYEIEIPDSAVEGMKTAGEVLAYLEKRMDPDLGSTAYMKGDT